MSVQAYNVPIVLPDLRKEESIRQVIDSLEYLEAVANDIFNRISFRVAENRDQLTSINNRINVAQAKIDKIRNSSSKATRVFSPPKYPAPDKFQDYETVFREVDARLQKVRKNKTPINSRVQEVTRDVLKAKNKKPFQLTLDTKRKFREGVIMDDAEQLGEGLGSLPHHLPSVSSLLLFNTAENPYRKYVVLDPLSGAKIKTRDKMIENESNLHEAPSSILHGEQLERGPKDSTLYIPVMTELPELEVPVSLPFLSHIADDVEYTADLGPSIAPSLANTTVPELPNLADPSAGDGPPLPPAPGEAPPPPGPPAPPPPPPPTTEVPPPPPPPPPGVSDSESEDDGEVPASQSTLPTGDDGRANLMEAIRKAGGASKAGLKSAKQRKKERKAKKEVEESPGDLLSDLSAALGRRRKAISGGRDKRDDPANTGGGSMMDKVAAMIPPPPPPGGGDDSHQGDSEGEVEW